MNAPWVSWSGLSAAYPAEAGTPRSPAEVVEAVAEARRRGTTVKMVGAGHSFTGIAAPEGTLLWPHRLSGILAVDRDAMTVTALAGTPLHELNAQLAHLGLSLHNMGDIDQQTLAGATSTGTHGTGGVRAALAAQITGLDLVTGTGELLHADATHNPDVFAVARIGLGALGLVTTMTFAVEPMFTLEAHETPMSWDRALSDFDEMTAQNHYCEMYWFPHTDSTQVKRNNRTLDPARPLPRWRRLLDDELIANDAFEVVNRLGARTPALVRPLAQLSARALSERTYSDDAHRVFTSPRRVVFREMEYAVPREVGLQALREVRALVERRGWRVSFPVEVRTAPADDIPLSTASGRDSMYLAFHVHQHTDHVAYFTEVERLLRSYDGRPHWGKLHTRTAEDLAPAYPRWEEFAAVRDRLDPDRLFSNAYLRTVLGS